MSLCFLKEAVSLGAVDVSLDCGVGSDGDAVAQVCKIV
jgi:hypothetical protein